MNKDLSIVEYVNQESVVANIQGVLKERTPQFITSIVSLVNSSDALKEADRKSLMGACLTAAALNLPINPNLGFAFIIPYKNNKTGITVAQFQMGYRGFIQLAMRSGQFKTINTSDVKEGEIKSMDRLSGEIEFSWLPDDERLKAKTVGYVAYLKLINGFEKSLYMTEEELKAHGVRFSQSMKRGFGLWKDDFDAMAKKTVIKLLLSKYAPMTTDMAKAQEADQAVIEDDKIEYLDNKAITPDEISRDKEQKRVTDFIANAKTVEELEQVKQTVLDWNDDKISDAFTTKLAELDPKV